MLIRVKIASLNCVQEFSPDGILDAVFDYLFVFGHFKVRDSKFLNQRKIPPGRVLHQSQSPPQIPADCLAHVGMLVRQLPWTVADAAHGRGLESELFANLPHGHWGDHSSSTVIFNHPNALDN